MPPIRYRRHFLIFISSAVATTLFANYAPISSVGFIAFSAASAYITLILLLSALLYGPVIVLTKNRKPAISTYVRRDLGIWAALWSILHTVMGLQVHMEGKMWQYFLKYSNSYGIYYPRIDFFGLSNYLGLVAALLMLLLLSISNDMSIRKLGRVRWKLLQQTAYLAGAFTVVHATIYIVLEDRQWKYVVLFIIMVLIVFICQNFAFRAVRKF